MPVSPTDTGELAPLWAIVTAPEAGPDVLGENCTLNVVDCPGPSVCGVRVWLKGPETETLVIVIDGSPACPRFVRVTVRGAEVPPTGTAPKSSWLGDGDR